MNLLKTYVKNFVKMLEVRFDGYVIRISLGTTLKKVSRNAMKLNQSIRKKTKKKNETKVNLTK